MNRIMGVIAAVAITALASCSSDAATHSTDAPTPTTADMASPTDASATETSTIETSATATSTTDSPPPISTAAGTPVQSGPIDPGMTRSGESVYTSATDVMPERAPNATG